MTEQEIISALQKDFGKMMRERDGERHKNWKLAQKINYLELIIEQARQDWAHGKKNPNAIISDLIQSAKNYDPNSSNGQR